MADTSRDVVRQLANISETLVEMVELLYKQAEEGSDGALLSAIEAQQQATVTMLDAIKVVRSDTRHIRNRTDEIHATVQGIRRQRQDNSMLGNLVQPDNKKTLRDSLGSIMIIAAGIVAVGAAFKLVGDVDFASVIALSLALPLIAMAFAKVAKIKDLTIAKVATASFAIVAMSIAMTASSWVLQFTAPISIGQALTIVIIAGTMAIAAIGVKIVSMAMNGMSLGKVILASAVMPFMSAGIVLSSWLLQLTAPISLQQGITAILVAGTMAVAAYAVKTISQAMNGVSKAGVVLASAVMPMMALGIVTSSWLLTKTSDISLKQGLSAIGVAAVLSVAAFGMAALIKGVKGATIQELVFGALAMPLIAGGIVLSSIILSKFNPVSIDIKSALSVALVMAGASLLMAVPIAAFSKLGLSPKDLAIGIVASVGIMGALALGSHLIAMGDYTNAPDLSWAAGVGLAIVAFTPAVAVLGMLSTVNPLALVLGVAGVIALGGALAATGSLISMGNYTNGPSVAWAAAFALSMVAMVPAVVVLGIPGMQIIAALGVASMLILAGGLVAIADVVRGGNYTGGPSVAWAGGIGLSLMMFGAALASISPGIAGRIFGETTESRLNSLVTMASKLSLIADAVRDGNYSGGPDAVWSEGVGTALARFAEAYGMVKPELMDRITGDSSAARMEGMVAMAGILPRIGLALVNATYGNAPTADWSEGVGKALVYFTEAVGRVKPSLLDMFTGDSMKKRMDAMVAMARALKRIGAVLTGATFGEAPKVEWANAVGGMLVNMARAISLLADEIDIDEVDGWMVALKTMVTRAVEMASSLSGAGTEEVTKSASGIGILAKSYNSLAASLVALEKSLKQFSSLKDLPELDKMTAGLVAMSLVDAGKLRETLDTVAKRTEGVQSMFAGASAAQKAPPVNNSNGDTLGSLSAQNQQQATAQRNSARGAGAPGPASAAPARQPTVQSGPVAMVNKNMERSLAAMEKHLAGILSVVSDLLDDARKPAAAPVFGK